MAVSDGGKTSKGKFHTIERPGQEADIDELFEYVFKRLDPFSILTRKGDIITYDGTNVARLAAGSDGQVLTARESAPSGLAWEDRATGTAGNGDLRYWFNGLPYGAL